MMGFNAGQAHEILAPYVEPIFVAILLLIVGVIGGGIGFLKIYYWSEPHNTWKDEKQLLLKSVVLIYITKNLQTGDRMAV